MILFIESLLNGDLAEAKEIIHAKIKDLVIESKNQVKLSMCEDLYGDCNDVGIELVEEIKGNVVRMGRTKLIKVRIRKGKIQRRKKLSAVKGYTTRGGKLVRMSATEIRHRKMSARKAKVKRRAKIKQSLRKRDRSLRRRHALGL